MQVSQPEIIAAALRRHTKLSLSESFDASRPGSKPSTKQQEILSDIGIIPYRYVVAANQSGKSSMVGRELAWILNNDHPTWTRPEAWGNESLLIIIAGQDRRMMEIELWSKKLQPFLNRADWREVRVGNSLQFTVNDKTGDQIVFISHNDSSEKNRIHMQGYVAHYVWLDEMPSSFKILEELQRRVESKQGYFIATFTPKFRNDQIRKVIEAVTPPLGKRYKLSKFDNPIYLGKEAEELAKLEGYPESYKNAILYGDWYTGDNAVYFFDQETMLESPDGYSPAWRHVEASDPAIQSKFGFTLWAEHPSTGIWYCIKSEYIEGILDPEKILEEVLKKTDGYNIVRRVSDIAPWYTNMASARGIKYMNPWNKTSRKEELIKGLQNALGKQVRIAPWCSPLVDEITSAQWSELAVGKIVNGQALHLSDSAQYFVDCRPKYEGIPVAQDFFVELREGNRKRKEKLHKQQLLKKRKKFRRSFRWRV